MSLIARFDGPRAPERTTRCADQAREAEFTNVQTHYRPQTAEHTVTGQAPAVPDTTRGLDRH